MGALFKLGALVMAASFLSAGCDRVAQSGLGLAKAGGPAQTCADAQTIEQVKAIIFDNARKLASSATKLAIPELAKQSVVKISLPLLDEYNKDTKKVSCSGRVEITFPDGAASALGGASQTSLDIKYTAQPAADGSGTVFTVYGADDLLQGIASADLSKWAARLDAPPQAEASAASEDQGSRDPDPAGNGVASPAAQPRLPTVAEMLRDDPSLAARERELATLYQNAIERDVTGQVKREQQAALAERNSCDSKTCLERWFRTRVAALQAWQG